MALAKGSGQAVCLSRSFQTLGDSGREVPKTSIPEIELARSVDDRLAHFMDRGRIRFLHRSNGVVLLATGLLAVLICLALRTVVDGRVLLGWLVIYVLVTPLRFAAFLAFRKSRGRLSNAAGHRNFVPGAALAGSAWGLAAIPLPWDDQCGTIGIVRHPKYTIGDRNEAGVVQW